MFEFANSFIYSFKVKNKLAAKYFFSSFSQLVEFIFVVVVSFRVYFIKYLIFNIEISKFKFKNLFLKTNRT